MGINKNAIAIKWDSEKEDVPKLIASGQGLLADRIKKLAEEADIPIVENPSMAEQMVLLEPGTQIPQELLDITAEIYAFIVKLDKFKM